MGSNPDQNKRHLARVVDLVLRGVHPLDSPIATNTEFQLGVNLRTARKLGLTIPDSMLGQASVVS